ncbi:HDOD domain-containing protein [Desulfovibrio subterraneus]|uniref:HD family phosphohydrolase n=1 Tax=Desulfovibrio subterraneus TaxID=2718620 RepID=A0A7J0BKH5_9BACT|nr:HDOD domain-containing protein [Desulfovibrio subterraneus]GFM33625.1 HD family phosphohydrolase [Desulfovibrio subterraneus]
MMQDMRTEYKGRVLAVKNLPTLPKVLEEVTRLMEDPSTSTEQIAKVITFDQVLSAKVLKMVNSPIYGFPGRISSIQHALVLLGFNVIRGLIISTSVFDDMNKAMVGLWEHSVGCALASGEVAKTLGLKDPEEYAVAGLLHDLGKVVAAVQLPEIKPELEKLVATQDITFLQAEKQLLGFGHDRVNAWLALHWNLPPNISEAISYHHKPLSAQLYTKYACVVHIGNFLTRVFEYGNGGDNNVPVLEPRAMKLLGINQRMLESLLDKLSDAFLEVSDLGFN